MWGEETLNTSIGTVPLRDSYLLTCSQTGLNILGAQTVATITPSYQSLASFSFSVNDMLIASRWCFLYYSNYVVEYINHIWLMLFLEQKPLELATKRSWIFAPDYCPFHRQ